MPAGARRRNRTSRTLSFLCGCEILGSRRARIIREKELREPALFHFCHIRTGWISARLIWDSRCSKGSWESSRIRSSYSGPFLPFRSENSHSSQTQSSRSPDSGMQSFCVQIGIYCSAIGRRSALTRKTWRCGDLQLKRHHAATKPMGRRTSSDNFQRNAGNRWLCVVFSALRPPVHQRRVFFCAFPSPPVLSSVLLFLPLLLPTQLSAFSPLSARLRVPLVVASKVLSPPFLSCQPRLQKIRERPCSRCDTLL